MKALNESLHRTLKDRIMVAQKVGSRARKQVRGRLEKVILWIVLNHMKGRKLKRQGVRTDYEWERAISNKENNN